MKLHNTFSRILEGLILVSFLLFFASAGFQDKSTSGWYQQFFPNLNGNTIQDNTFLDSLTGFAVTTTTSSLSYILKTTNGGDNWIINYTSNTTWGFRRIISIDSNTIFAVRSYTEILKTTNKGSTWEIIPLNIFCDDISILNKDTMLVVSSSGFDGGVYRTTNGGYNWQALGPTGGSGQPSSIYMYNKDMGFCLGGQMRKTTNGGVNWFAIIGETYTSIMFVDSLTGWKVTDSIKKTTNGGINWVTQKTPIFSSYFSNNTSFSILNKDTVWMVGAEKYGRPPLYKTTNGGINWGYQFPDTTLQRYSFSFISFADKLNGWIYPSSITVPSESHTVTGGNDTTYITGINNNITSVPKDYILSQNYPNPFNNSTIINYKLSIKGEIKLIVYNIMGKEVNTLINKKQTAGTYDVSFNAGNLSSGFYFYTLFADGIIIDTKRALLIK